MSKSMGLEMLTQFVNMLTLTLLLPTPRLSAEVAFVRPEKEEQDDWLV
jgi:hypothetical protein